MVDPVDVLRYSSAAFLLGIGVGGLVATLIGIESTAPVYFLAAVAAGVGALPEVTAAVRRHLPV